MCPIVPTVVNLFKNKKTGMDEKSIEKIVREQIEKVEKLGDQAGGSGHMGHISYRIDGIKTKELEDGNREVSYDYTLMVETEFTYYPDNPPHEISVSGILVLDPQGRMIE